MRFGLRREPQKDSCKAAQGKCSFPWDGIGLAHKRQLRFHRAVCKTAISPERCIIAPFILKGFGRCCVRERHAPSLQEPARLLVDGTKSSKVPSPDHRSVLPDRPESFPAFRHECKDDAHALSDSALTSGVQGSSLGAGKSAASALLWLFRCGGRQGRFWVGAMASSSFYFSHNNCIGMFSEHLTFFLIAKRAITSATALSCIFSSVL